MARPALNQSALYAFKYYQDKYGLKPYQAAGIIGNLFQESTMNPGSRNIGDGRDGSDSIGIGQWNGDRAKAFKAYAGDNAGSLDTQLDYVIHEMKNGPEKYAYNQLMNSQNEVDATKAMIGYERPHGYSRDNPTAGHGWDNRVGVAQELLGRSPEEIAQAKADQTQVVAQAPSPKMLLADNTPATPAADTATDSKPLINLPKLPDNIFGGDLTKGAKLLSLGAAFADKDTESMNKQVPKGGLLGSKQVEIAPMSSMAGGAQDIAGLDPDELLQMLMRTRSRGGRLL